MSRRPTLVVPSPVPTETDEQRALAAAALPVVVEGTDLLARGLRLLAEARDALQPAFDDGIADTIVHNHGDHHAGRPMLAGERLLDAVSFVLLEIGSDGAELVKGLRQAAADAQGGEVALITERQQRAADRRVARARRLVGQASGLFPKAIACLEAAHASLRPFDAGLSAAIVGGNAVDSPGRPRLPAEQLLWAIELVLDNVPAKLWQELDGALDADEISLRARWEAEVVGHFAALDQARAKNARPTEASGASMGEHLLARARARALRGERRAALVDLRRCVAATCDDLLIARAMLACADLVLGGQAPRRLKTARRCLDTARRHIGWYSGGVPAEVIADSVAIEGRLRAEGWGA